MHKKWALRWASALESGRYKQTKGYLRCEEKDQEVKNGYAPPGYCCLGVLQEIAGCRIKRGRGALSKACMKITGIKHGDGACITAIKYKGDSVFSLDVANDKGVSFKRIAKYVRRYYETL